MEVRVKVPGTCGELVQGIKKNKNFHITCPINLFSYVSASLNSSQIEPSFIKPKAYQAMKKMLKFFHKENTEVKIQIFSQIPMEKGMASSTADIVGVCSSIAILLGEEISAEEIAKIALSIEPTDGIMFKKIVCFDHLKGKISEVIGKPPRMKILVIDPGTHINTLEFHKRTDLTKLYLKIQNQSLKALKLVERGIKEQNIELIGEGATISALANQKILFKSHLNQILSVSKKMGALGVNIAHSGTVIGVLLPPDFSRWDILERNLQRTLNERLTFYRTSLIEGGWKNEIFSWR